MIPFLSRVPWRLVGLAAIAAGAFLTGWMTQDWRRDSMDLVALEAAEKASDAMTRAAVSAIKNNRPVFQRIYQRTEKEFHHDTRYLSDTCSHNDATWGLLDSAYQAAGGEPFGGGAGLPDAAGTAGPDTGVND